ncbi:MULTISPECIES: alpha/beta family hydrolase [unclassified Variovorax]|uniref:alpha/beta hydrolase family protein n=1 Tax=unclassified Variovorax TaxID=663243 RepID=UPI001BD67128|nr:MULTISPECIES: alpha/beta family hydrolase [unclassified Variovorax]
MTSTSTAEPVTIPLDDGSTVSGLALAPPDPVACYMLAHGAGAGMTHHFMAAAAEGLAQRGIATLRYQFPYMEAGGKRPDTPAKAHATVRAAVAEASRRFGSLPLVAGGKSFGGRMTSQAQALGLLPSVAGLVFLGFPLHPAGEPSITRAKHLSDVRVPMLFIQGTIDKLAELGKIRSVVADLGERATIVEIEHADHAFHVLKRTGRNDDEVLAQALDSVAAWVRRLAAT